MRTLHLEGIHALEFLEYANMVSGYVVDSEFHAGMIFNDRKAVILVVKNYSISRSVDYKVHKLEPLTFYCKCKHFGSGRQWLIKVSFRKN